MVVGLVFVGQERLVGRAGAVVQVARRTVRSCWRMPVKVVAQGQRVGRWSV